jgi:hypothetical protein
MSQLEVGDMVLIPQSAVLHIKTDDWFYMHSIMNQPTYGLFYGYDDLDYGKVIINDLVWYIHVDSIYKGDKYVSPVNRSV